MLTAENKNSVINTERLTIRPVQKDDLEDFHEIFTDPEALEYFAQEPAADLEVTRRFVEEKLEANRGEHKFYWAVCLAQSGKMIGQFTLFNFSKPNRRAEVGYIFNRKFWRKGYASEVLEAMIEYSFSELDMGRLEADADPENAGSLGLLEKHGFEREGYFRKRWYFRERWYDSVMLGLLRPGLD